MEGRYRDINNLPNPELIKELVKVLEEKFQHADRVFVFNMPDPLKDLFKRTFGTYVEKSTFKEWVIHVSNEFQESDEILGEPYIGDSGKTSTLSTGFHLANKASINFHFESGNEWKENSKSGSERKEINIQVMLKATRKVLHEILESSGRNTKDAERVGLRLALIYLLQNNGATDEELKKGVKSLAEEFGLKVRLNSMDKILSTLRHLPGVKAGFDSLNIRHYELSDGLRIKILNTYVLLSQVEESIWKYSTSGDGEELIRAFVNFFRDYVDDSGKSKYIDELRRLLTVGPSKSLFVDFSELNSIAPALAEKLLNTPEVAISAAEDAVQIILKEPPLLFENPPKIRVCFVNLPTTLSPREVRSEHVGKLVQVRGVISAIAEGERTNGVKGFIERAVFVCKDCGNEMVRLQRPYENFIVPQKCDACGSRNIELDLERCHIVDMREIFVQDPADAMHASGTASYIRVILLDDNARMDINPGDEVLITGIVRGVMTKKNGTPTLGWILEGNALIKLTKDIEDLEITPEDERKFREMVKDPEFDKKLIQSIAPDIIGREVEKKAALLPLFSGEDYEIEGVHVKKRSHVLLFGDAGTGKSAIIRYIFKIAPRAAYSTGTHASGAGLTAAIDSLDGKRVLKAGVLVLADRGVAVIDELDKMKDEEYQRMLDAMEQGWFNFNKAGFNTKLMARAIIIAAANPPGGEFDTYNYTPFDELKRLFDQPFYSRFDLIIPTFRDRDSKVLEKIAEAVLNKHMGGVKPPYDPETLTKFIAYARKAIPRVRIPESLQAVMKKHMVELAKALGSSAPRAMEALIRLTEAHARMHLREEATLADFLAARELFEEMLTRLAASDDEEKKKEVLKGLAGVIWSEERKQKVDKIWSILKYYEAFDDTGDGVHVNNIIEEAKQYGISKEEVILLLEDMERENMVERTKLGFYRLKRRGRS
ncbi:ATP-binding protein [Palaeococcus sp. (in: euryarchaeotes)]